MPVAVQIKIDTRPVRRELSRIAERQVPFAIAFGLTAIAKASQGEIVSELPSIFTKVSAFTRNAIAIKPATKGDLVASVLVKDVQARYLSIEETGGTRTPADNTRKASKALTLPGANAKLTATGNLPYGYVQRLAQQAAKTAQPPTTKTRRGAPARPSVIRMSQHGPNGRGPGGFFMRLPNDKLVRLISFVSEAQYQPKFGFVPRVTAFSSSVAPSLLRAAVEKALATSR